jgi:hypothetical protein
MKKYYIRVELRDYSDRIIATGDSTCQSDISNKSILDTTAHAVKTVLLTSIELHEERARLADSQ